MSITHSFKVFLVSPEMLSARSKEDSFSYGYKIWDLFSSKVCRGHCQGLEPSLVVVGENSVEAVEKDF